MATESLGAPELEGWIVFVEAVEIAPAQWRGTVRIRADATGLLVRLRCTSDHPAKADALADADVFARCMLAKIGLRLQTHRHPANATHDVPPP